MKKILFLSIISLYACLYVHAQNWLTTGNSGLAASNFLGTKDAAPLTFKVNNKLAGKIDFTIAKANVSLGFQSLNAITSGSSNAAFGFQSMFSNTTAYGNTANGYKSLYKNTTGNFNTAVGSQALYSNASGFNNTAIGTFSLLYNTQGVSNTAAGFSALSSNISGSYNTASGVNALYNNISGSNNTAAGSISLNSNTTGSENTANGYQAMRLNTTGGRNAAFGNNSLYNNTTGNNNTAYGDSALWGTQGGNYNTAVGYGSLANNNSGSNNTAIGFMADLSPGNLTNATALGAQAYVTTDNQVMLGNTLITSVFAAGSYMIYSDGRFKKNIKENVPGLDFIKQLRPVTYNYDIHKLNGYIKPNKASKDKSGENENAIAKKEHKLYTGLIAQEVEKVTDKMGYEFSGLHKPENDNDPYGLSYADFVVPLVKAVQQLSQQNDEQKKINADLQKQIEALKAMIVSNQSTVSGQVSTILSSAALEQNIPNPFNHTTVINYTLPQTYSSAKIIITDKSGKTLKEINISGSGKGSLKTDASTLASGDYNYSLYLNNKLVDTKQMIITTK